MHTIAIAQHTLIGLKTTSLPKCTIEYIFNVYGTIHFIVAHLKIKWMLKISSLVCAGEPNGKHKFPYHTPCTLHSIMHTWHVTKNN